MYKFILFAVSFFSFIGCAHTFVPQTPAATESGYTYIPIDPFPVLMYPDKESCNLSSAKSKEEYDSLLKKIRYRPLLESLPDNAVRVSVEQINSSGNVNYGPAGIGAKGESYRVTVDYVSSDTTNFHVFIAKTAFNKTTGNYNYVDLLSPVDKTIYDINSIEYEVKGAKGASVEKDKKKNYYEYNIPVYVGIGLRVTAYVDVIGATANISGLGVIGAEAEANSLKGSLIVQTLGINGQAIAAALPIQSELNRLTAQNAIVAVGSIKALLYDEKTATTPRVVGIYLPLPGGKPLVNAIISEISKSHSIEWIRHCVSEDNNPNLAK